MIQTVTQFTDQVLITVEAQASGHANFGIAGQRLYPATPSAPAALDGVTQLAILTEAFKMVAAKVLGSEHQFIHGVDLMKAQLGAELQKVCGQQVSGQ